MKLNDKEVVKKGYKLRNEIMKNIHYGKLKYVAENLTNCKTRLIQKKKKRKK